MKELRSLFDAMHLHLKKYLADDRTHVSNLADIKALVSALGSDIVDFDAKVLLPKRVSLV